MLLLSSKKKTPGSRHKISIKSFLFKNWKKKKHIKLFSNKKNLKKPRRFKRRVYFIKKNLKTNFQELKNSSYIFQFFGDIMRPLTVSKSLYGLKKIQPYISYHYPGFINYSPLTILFKRIPGIGQYLPLKKVPLNYNVSFVSQTLKTLSVYAKSLGSFALKKKIDKKTKLIQVQLPSKKLKYFKPDSYVFFGVAKFWTTQPLCDGKWGFTSRKFKTINVRGVAKNPVDHPNGGRTKAKQPEKNPWGFIAKHGK